MATKKKAAGKKKTKAKPTGDQLNLDVVRQEISQTISKKANSLVTKAIEEAEEGHASPALKYLFEIGGLYPNASDDEEPEEQDESLAHVLLRRLGLPDEPAEVKPAEPQAASPDAGGDAIK
jgi:hypothetical protein